MNMCYVKEYDGYMFSRLNTATGYRDSVGTHVYVRDWQGNIRAVVRKDDDGSTVLEQATYYYPYGMPMAESTNPTANSYKYTGKELLTDKGVNIYDYIARAYDPATCRWWSVDEHSADYSPLSHYSMCGGDPINFIDINGKDIFRFNQKGELLERITDDTKDLLQMQIGAGDDVKIIDGPQFEYGTIENCRTIPGIEGRNDKATILQIRGDENGKSAFEFFADNGSVELSHFQTGLEGDNGLNFITTSHTVGEEFGGGALIKFQLTYDYTVRTHTHYHPSQNLNPSDADIIFRDRVRIYINFTNTQFKIYVKDESYYGGKGYYNYTSQPAYIKGHHNKPIY